MSPTTRSSRRRERAAASDAVSPASLLVAAGVGVGALVAASLARSRESRPHPLDRTVRRRLGARRRDRIPRSAWWFGPGETRAHRVAEAVGGMTGERVTLGLGTAAALAVAKRRGVRTAIPVLAAVPLGLSAHAAIKYAIRRPRPITAMLTGKRTPSFPSGHAARGAAAGLAAYVAAREGLVRAPLAAAIGGAIAASAASRVYVDRHWATDAIGGWGLGAAAAALCALWYDAERGRKR